jgi:hypothetical protein
MKINNTLLLLQFPVIFDTSEAIQILREFGDPKSKLRDLVRGDYIVRIKQGLYAIAPQFRRGPFPVEVLANRTYWPSYVSLEWALAYHNFIPESPRQITSIAMRNSPSSRMKRFRTPEGVFAYRHIPASAYPRGVGSYEAPFGEGVTAFAMALPEKALADKVFFEKGLSPIISEIREYLRDNLRIEETALSELDHMLMDEIADGYRSRKIEALARALKGR